MSKHVSIEDRQKAIKMCKTKSYKEVAAIFGVYPDTVRGWKSGKYTYRLEQSKLETKLKPKAKKLYQKYGLGSAARVSRELKIPLGTTKRWLREDFDLSINLPDEIRTKARALYLKHFSIFKVGDILGIDSASVHLRVKDLIPKNHKKRFFTKKEKGRALRLRREGWNVSSIANEIGCFSPTVTRWIQIHGTGTKKNGQWIP